MKYLNRTVRTVFIILGKGCNFNCLYCMQRKTQDAGIVYPSEINEDIFEFIEEISENQKQPFYIHFYGGEPLLYKNKLMYITEKLCHLHNVKFSVITNGSLIDDEYVDFFNKYEFCVNISWDGSFSEYTRKRNVFQENKNVLFKINNLGVSSVVSAVTPLDKLLEDIQELSNEYYANTNRILRINIDEIFDTNIEVRSLLNIDYDKYSQMSRSIARECLNIKTGKIQISNEEYIKKYNAKMAFFDKIYNVIARYAKDTNRCVMHMANCCNGIEVINLDLEGNLYSCHNCDTKIGNIYSDFVNVLDQLFKNDKIQYYYDTYCKDCIAYPACRGGCKLVDEQARNESYCKLKRAIFIPIIEELINVK